MFVHNDLQSQELCEYLSQKVSTTLRHVWGRHPDGLAQNRLWYGSLILLDLRLLLIEVVSCMDPRCDPHQVLGLKMEEAFCLMNVSGRIKPALSDIATLDSLFGLEQIIVVHHSNCGSTHGTIEQLRQHLKSNSPNLSSQEVEDVAQGSAIRTDDDSWLKADLKLLRECKFIRKDLAESAVGLWFDVDTGLASEVNPSDGR